MSAYTWEHFKANVEEHGLDSVIETLTEIGTILCRKDEANLGGDLFHISNPGLRDRTEETETRIGLVVRAAS